MDDKVKINKVKNRVLFLSPTVKQGLEKECTRSDFNFEGDGPFARGGFGKVYKVKHKITKKVYVLKIIDKKSIIEEKMVNQINREIEIMYSVDHPHIIKLINHFEDDVNFYLIMNFAEKGQVYSLLRKQGKIDERTAAQFLRETIEAFKYLHNFNPQIIHRDLKPENLLLDKDLRIKLADFGWSNFNSDEIRKTYCGTPDYLAPEMINKNGHDTSVDIWSIGVLLFEMLAGYSPFSATNQQDLFNNIKKLRIKWSNDFPPLAKNLVAKILQFDPKERITLDEILSHSWFEINPPLKPILTNHEIDEKTKLESHLINVNPELVKDKINDIYNQTKEIVRNSRLINSENVMKKLNDCLMYENKNLEKEILELKKKIQQYDTELKNLRSENAKLKSDLEKDNFEDECIKLRQENEKYKIINKERLDLITDIEIKNNTISELNYKLKNFEVDILALQKMNVDLINNLNEMRKIIEIKDQQIFEINQKLSESNKANDDLSKLYQYRIEDLSKKVFGDYYNVNVDKFYIILNESIIEFSQTISKKINYLCQVLCDIKNEFNKNEDKLSKMLKERHDNIIELIEKTKNNINKNYNFNINSKSLEKLEWMKKQIDELIPFKKKSLNFENKNVHLESINITINKFLEMSDQRITYLEKIKEIRDTELDELNANNNRLHNKISDLKIYITDNYPQLSDELNVYFINN